ncbi:uncharacterized protein LAESUDRAFT_765141 [Laetiporus sulphureus 93-53]|uniref:Uncharacterized protein n=1 Tax=Laetiporus sulphureus 93-53 TaxID=1314785 RepID=A0A165AXY6_9APHY|nr:uncharacterized protein LAESUDRAFT_765141 [Laetiporus sulphureus 93-53]KZS99869.1 hypothetical protein LAESUDRAFT_765141 [Laetiporus sulphureus 93-53]
MPKPDVESDTEGAPEIVTVKQEKGTTGPSRHKLVIPPPLHDHFDRPPKCPRFDDFNPDDIGSSKAMTVKSEPIHASTAVIEPSEASTQLEWMIKLSQQLLKENHALRAHKS